jgi:hypothetical protein
LEGPPPNSAFVDAVNLSPPGSQGHNAGRAVRVVVLAAAGADTPLRLVGRAGAGKGRKRG